MRRVLLKLSGEALGYPDDFPDRPNNPIRDEVFKQVAAEVFQARNVAQVAILPGGGNIFRGKAAEKRGMDRIRADYAGMIATILNSQIMEDALIQAGFLTEEVRLHTALEIKQVGEPFISKRAVHQLNRGMVVILGGGMGQPLFTTDTAAVQLGAVLRCDIVFKGTHSGVEGVYSADPRRNPDAEFIDELPISEAVKRELEVMDMTAMTHGQDNRIPIRVFDVLKPGNLYKALSNEPIGSLIYPGDQP